MTEKPEQERLKAPPPEESLAGVRVDIQGATGGGSWLPVAGR